MKMKWLIIATLFPAFLLAQQSSLSATISSGLVAGESVAKPLFQATSGLSYKKWFAGIGTGLDFYNLRSIPLFAEYKVGFGKKGIVFAYGDLGYNFPFGNKGESPDFFKTFDRYYGGVYLDAGIGYRLRLSSNHQLLFSGGYSRKDIIHKVAYIYPGTPTSSEQVYRYHYNFGRAIFKLGWEFGRR